MLKYIDVLRAIETIKGSSLLDYREKAFLLRGIANELPQEGYEGSYGTIVKLLRSKCTDEDRTDLARETPHQQDVGEAKGSEDPVLGPEHIRPSVPHDVDDRARPARRAKETRKHSRK